MKNIYTNYNKFKFYWIVLTAIFLASEGASDAAEPFYSFYEISTDSVPGSGSTMRSSSRNIDVTGSGSRPVTNEYKFNGIETFDMNKITTRKELDAWIKQMSSLDEFCKALPLLWRGLEDGAIENFRDYNNNRMRIAHLDVRINLSIRKECEINPFEPITSTSNGEVLIDCRSLCPTPVSNLNKNGLFDFSASVTPASTPARIQDFTNTVPTADETTGI